ncbi:META domain-containing protein [Streptomyces sp. NPDC014724]|uniref:META domain-containing protein n=1 Tax=unclassified Streptomyces TaxID=2593676 RepID=UPI0036FC6B06
MALAVLGSLLVLTSCGTETGDDPRSGAGSGGAVRTELPATGTTWTVTSLVSGSVASSLPAGTEGKARIVFGKDGSVHGSFGCNGFRGRATVSGSTITFASVGSTKMMCPDPRMKLERAVLAILDGKATYRIDHRGLSLTAENGEGLGASAAEKTRTGGTTG